MWIFLAGVAAALAYGVVVFNRCIKYKTLMREASSGIDVQLKRRHDLIPNIVATVKGYMRHEATLLENIASLRSQLTGLTQTSEKKGLENSLSAALKTLFALAENYPDLKANQSFLQLHESLVEIEDQIQLARRYYNGTVRNYNILVESFPSNLMARVFHFAPADFFELEFATQASSPEVRFAQ